MDALERSYAVCRCAEWVFAVPLSCIVEALPRPAALQELQGARGRSTAVFTLRGQVIPLCNLGDVLGASELVGARAGEREFAAVGAASPQHDPRTPTGNVLVLSHEGRWLGVEIEALLGMHKVGPEGEVPVSHDTQDFALFHAVIRTPDASLVDSGLIGVLDVAALFAAGKRWSPAADNRSNLAAQQLVAAGAARVQALVSVHGQGVLIDARYLFATVQLPALQRFGNPEQGTLGLVRWQGQDLEVVQLNTRFGGAATEAGPLMAVIRVGDRQVALALDRARQILRLKNPVIHPSSACGIPSDSGFSGMVYADDGEMLLVLDCEHLVQRAAQFSAGAAQAMIQAQAQGQGTTENATQWNQEAYVVFQAGAALALPLTAVESILALPARLDRSYGGHSAQLGTTAWRQEGLALWDLRRLSGAGATQLDREVRVIVTRVHGRTVGLVCEQLLKLLPARQGQMLRLPRNGQREVTMISVQATQGTESFRVLVPEELVPEIA